MPPIPDETPAMEYEDRILVCADGEHDFVWSARDQEFYARHSYVPPKRCKDHRDQRAAARRGREERTGRGRD